MTVLEIFFEIIFLSTRCTVEPRGAADNIRDISTDKFGSLQDGTVPAMLPRVPTNKLSEKLAANSNINLFLLFATKTTKLI